MLPTDHQPRGIWYMDTTSKYSKGLYKTPEAKNTLLMLCFMAMGRSATGHLMAFVVHVGRKNTSIHELSRWKVGAEEKNCLRPTHKVKRKGSNGQNIITSPSSGVTYDSSGLESGVSGDLAPCKRDAAIAFHPTQSETWSGWLPNACK